MSVKKRKITDAVEILDEIFFKGRPEMQALLEVERANAEIARQIYDLRTKAGLTQSALAKLVGTTPSVICRLEDDDYEGHSLTMLHRIANALHRRVQVRFIAPSRRLQHA